MNFLEKRLRRLPSWASDEISKSLDPDADVTALQIAHRIIKSHGGTKALQKLLSMFEDGVSITEIGDHYSMTKQRVSQWRKALGYVEEKFVARPVIKKALKDGFSNA